MKGEGLLLNAACIVMAVLFLGLAALNFFNAGNFISTDSLFFTTVSGMMALIFLMVPLATLMSARKTKASPATGEAVDGKRASVVVKTRGGSKLLQPVRYADAVDAKGRRIPPDVARMVEIIKER